MALNLSNLTSLAQESVITIVLIVVVLMEMCFWLYQQNRPSITVRLIASPEVLEVIRRLSRNPTTLPDNFADGPRGSQIYLVLQS
jgi:hypothetical protein